MILPNTDIDVDYPEFDFLPFGDYQLAHSDVSLLWPSMGSIASRIFEIEGTVSPKDLFTPPAEDMTSTWVNNTCFPSSPPAEHDNPFELDTSDEAAEYSASADTPPLSSGGDSPFASAPASPSPHPWRTLPSLAPQPIDLTDPAVLRSLVEHVILPHWDYRLDAEGKPDFIDTDPRNLRTAAAASTKKKGKDKQKTPEEKAHRKFLCPYCVERFDRAHDLRRHARGHTLDKPYPCHACGQWWNRIEARGRHHRTSRICKDKHDAMIEGEVVPPKREIRPRAPRTRPLSFAPYPSRR